MRAAREHIAVEHDTSWHLNVRREPAFAFLWHFHPEIELTLITRGSGTRIVGDTVENYRPGDLTLIGSNLPHAYASGADASTQHEAVVVHLRRDFLGADFLTRPEFRAVGDLLDAASLGLNLTVGTDTAAAFHALATAPAPDRTVNLIRILVGLAGRNDLRTLATAGPRPLSPTAHERIEAVYAYLAEAYTRTVTLADVAAVAHMTPTAFSRFFRRTSGRTLTAYVTELRIAAACRLLTDTDLPVAVIAARTGYGNLSNFNRRFRSVTGSSPREHRRAARFRAWSGGDRAEAADVP